MQIVAASGVESLKTFKEWLDDPGIEKAVIPFAGTDCKGSSAKLGVGLIIFSEEKVVHWGLVLPRNLLQSWRAMKILEQIPKFAGVL